MTMIAFPLSILSLMVFSIVRANMLFICTDNHRYHNDEMLLLLVITFFRCEFYYYLILSN